MKLSFIVPAYNCAQYIAECLDSLLCQGFGNEEFEVVIVNDGSTDNSADIVSEYCERHHNIRLINQDNQGVGAARNHGIAEAKGEYIHFMDADDWLVEGCMSDIFRISSQVAEIQPDIIAFDVQHVYESGIYEHCTIDDKNITTGTLVQNANNSRQIKMCCWKTIIRRDIANKYRFKDYKIAEDLDYMLNLYLYEDKINVIEFPAKVYCYRQHNNSAMHNLDKAASLQTFETINQVYAKLKDNWANTGLSEQTVDALCYELAYAVIFRMLSARYSYKECRKILKKYTSTGLLPMTKQSNYVDKIFSAVSKSSLLLWLVSPLYSRIYLPFFKKNF